MIDSRISAIANAIRQKNGSDTLYTISDMAQAILAIPSGGPTPTGEIEITENGTFDVTQFASALVNVESGGGGGTFVSKCDIGELYTERTDGSITISHNLGVAPTMALVIRKDITNIPTDTGSTLGGMYMNSNSAIKNLGYTGAKDTGALGISTSMTIIQNVTDESIDFVARARTSPIADGEYVWMVVNHTSQIQPPAPSGIPRTVNVSVEYSEEGKATDTITFAHSGIYVISAMAGQSGDSGISSSPSITKETTATLLMDKSDILTEDAYYNFGQLWVVSATVGDTFTYTRADGNNYILLEAYYCENATNIQSFNYAYGRDNEISLRVLMPSDYNVLIIRQECGFYAGQTTDTPYTYNKTPQKSVSHHTSTDDDRILLHYDSIKTNKTDLGKLTCGGYGYNWSGVYLYCLAFVSQSGGTSTEDSFIPIYGELVDSDLIDESVSLSLSDSDS